MKEVESRETPEVSGGQTSLESPVSGLIYPILPVIEPTPQPQPIDDRMLVIREDPLP